MSVLFYLCIYFWILFAYPFSFKVYMNWCSAAFCANLFQVIWPQSLLGYKDICQSMSLFHVGYIQLFAFLTFIYSFKFWYCSKFKRYVKKITKHDSCTCDVATFRSSEHWHCFGDLVGLEQNCVIFLSCSLQLNFAGRTSYKIQIFIY